MSQIQKPMIKRKPPNFILLAMLSACAASVPNVLEAQQADFVPGRVIVKYRAGSSDTRGAALRDAVGSQMIKRLPLINADLVTLPDGWDVDSAVEWYGSQVGVEYAEPDYMWYAIENIPAPSTKSLEDMVNSLSAVTPNDPRFGEMWGLNNTGQSSGLADADIDAPEAWSITKGTDTLIVGVIDTGMQTAHPDLAGNMWVNPGETAGDGVDNDGNGFVDDVHGWDFRNDDASVYDDASIDSHGTHVAGTIGAVSNNGVGITGIAWNVKIMSLKFLHNGGSTSDAIDAIQYAIDNGAHMTTNSWGGGGSSTALQDAIKASGDAGMLFLAASGNSALDADQTPMYPAAYPQENIISVNSTDRNDQLSSFSNYGLTSTDLGAPGSSILSTVPADGYASYSGTSMATPHVTGVAVLIYTAFPDLTHMEVKDRLMWSGDPITALYGKSVSGRRLNANNALDNDSIPPSAVANLTVTEDPVSGSIAPLGGTALTVSWTAPGDDGSSGTASQYDIRYATTPITDDAKFNQAMQATAEPYPSAAGTTQSATVIGLDPESTYYFALKTSDNVGNQSPLSNSAEGETGMITRLFADGAETEASVDLWKTDPPWGRTSTSSSPEDSSIPLGGNWSWTDSPSGNYSDGINSSLQSIPIDLSGASNPVLQFDHRYDIENYWDRGYIEVSTNGIQWTELAQYTNVQEAWTSESFTLNSYEGAEAFQFRFRLETDGSVGKDGWYIDDVRVIADTDAVLALSIALDASGDTALASLSLENKEDIVGLSYQLSWGSNNDVTGENPLSFHTSTLTNRVSALTHTFEVNPDSDVLTGILISTSGTGEIAAGSGPIIEYRFPVRSDIESVDGSFVSVTQTGGPGSSVLPKISIRAPFSLVDGALSDSKGNALETGLEDPTSVSIVDSLPNADVDFSGTINIADVVRIIDFYLGRTEPSALEFAVADTYRDQRLNVVDIVRGINIVLGRTIGNSASSQSALLVDSQEQSDDPTSDRQLEVAFQSISAPESSRTSPTGSKVLVADVPTGVVGLELGVKHGASQVADARLLLEGDDFSLVKNIGSTGSSFMIYSANNSSLPEGSQPVLELELKTTSSEPAEAGNELYLSEVLGVDDSGTPIYPNVDPMLAVQDLLGTPSLLPVQRMQLDRRGNSDGMYNLGDLLSLMHRTGFFPIHKGNGVAR